MKENSRKGITAIELLQVAFIVLKLCKVISWSWLWVLSPMWITTAITVLLAIVFYIKYAIEDGKERRMKIAKETAERIDRLKNMDDLKVSLERKKVLRSLRNRSNTLRDVDAKLTERCEYWDGESGFCALQRPADSVRRGKGAKNEKY